MSPGENTAKLTDGMPVIKPSGLADGFLLTTGDWLPASYTFSTTCPATGCGPLRYVRALTSTPESTMYICHLYGGVPLPLPGHDAPDGGARTNSVALPP
jgi:hypothetical protein